MSEILDHDQRWNCAVVVKNVELLHANAAVVVHPLAEVISLVLQHQTHCQVGSMWHTPGVPAVIAILEAAVAHGCPFRKLQLATGWPGNHNTDYFS